MKSQSLRRTDADPDTPIRDIVSLLEHPGDAIEIQVDDRLFVIRWLDDEATKPARLSDALRQDETDIEPE